jgi:hypothetical protein
MIFERVPVNEITSQLLAKVRERETRNSQLLEQRRADRSKIDRESLLQVFD